MVTTIQPTGRACDILIALIALENKLLLLHNDRDFDAIASRTPGLEILNALSRRLR